jgi:Uncharacterized protein conserved in bacteria
MGTVQSLLPKADNTGFTPNLFAKKDRSNIDSDELAGFKKLAALYSRQTDVTINAQLKNGDLVEICHAQQT